MSMSACRPVRENSTTFYTSHLRQEGDNIAQNEYLGQPFKRYHRVALSANKANDSSKDGIDRCSEECWCHEQKDTLHNVRTQCPDVVCRDGSADVSDYFDFAKNQGSNTMDV